MDLLNALDLLGVGVFAASGALAAGYKRMDGFGVVVLALVTATGGGTLRDLILDVPVFWIENQGYLLAAVSAALLTMATARWWYRRLEAILVILDAVGLGFYAMVGTARSVAAGVPASVAITLGVLTGCGGGIIRDLLAGEIPFVFRGQLYATAALAGSSLYLALLHVQVPAGPALVAGTVTSVAIRMAAVRWNIRLPLFNLTRPHEDNHPADPS